MRQSRGVGRTHPHGPANQKRQLVRTEHNNHESHGVSDGGHMSLPETMGSHDGADFGGQVKCDPIQPEVPTRYCLWPEEPARFGGERPIYRTGSHMDQDTTTLG
jgi:hypothetical protein